MLQKGRLMLSPLHDISNWFIYQCVSIKRKPTKTLQKGWLMPSPLHDISNWWYIHYMIYSIPSNLNLTLSKGDLQSQKKSHIESWKKQKIAGLWFILPKELAKEGARGDTLISQYSNDKYRCNILSKDSYKKILWKEGARGGILWYQDILMTNIAAISLQENFMEILNSSLFHYFMKSNFDTQGHAHTLEGKTTLNWW